MCVEYCNNLNIQNLLQSTSETNGLNLTIMSLLRNSNR